MINKLGEKILNGKTINNEEAIYLINLEDKSDELFFYANKIRKKYQGDKVKLCSIVNAKSGACGENCKFCAQSVHYNTGIEIYPLKSSQEIINVAKKSAKSKVSGFGIVTSGAEINDFELDCICQSIKSINVLNVYSCASLGRLSLDKVKRLKQNGLKKYHHNLETSRRFFENICSSHTYDEKMQTIKLVKEAGLEVCCGGIFGIGETKEDIIDLAFTIKSLKADSIPVNFLNPRPGTPLENQKLLSPLSALMIIAVYRFIFPDKDIIVCGGRELVLRDLQSWIFYAGANGLMTGNYLTTSGRSVELDLKMIKDLGLKYE